jgi:hypothetical protein
VQFHIADHLGSSTVVVDDTGALVNREEFTPYGETSFGSFARKRYRYTGKERDEESGLAYHGARYLHPPWVVGCRAIRRPSRLPEPVLLLPGLADVFGRSRRPKTKLSAGDKAMNAVDTNKDNRVDFGEAVTYWRSCNTKKPPREHSSTSPTGVHPEALQFLEAAKIAIVRRTSRQRRGRGYEKDHMPVALVGTPRGRG